LSVSRTTFKWGVPVPGDDDHIMYVWLDALTNYITAVGYPDTASDRFKQFWPADLHMVGKDILRFHAVYWPAFLMAAGIEAPKRIYAHGWWTNEGEKISKSLGNIIDPHALIETYGLDPVRYFLMREVPFGNDGDFSHRSMIHRMNGDLANDLGNLCQRVLSMIAKNCSGRVPPRGDFTQADNALLDKAVGLIAALRRSMGKQQFHSALIEIWEVVGDANRYVDTQAPWALRKTDPARMETVLYVLAETIRCIGLYVQPFMPAAAGAILDQIAVSERDFDALGHRLESGLVLPKPTPVFPRFIEDDKAAG
jgi:methionyl-tRNA synthetase